MVEFKPRERKAGDLIRSDEWNAVQREIRDDLQGLEDGLARAESRPSVLAARGYASHDVYVSLGWDVEPQLFVRLSHAFSGAAAGEAEAVAGWDVSAEERTPAGFRVRAGHNVFDATLDGLLGDRVLIEGRLLDAVEASGR